MYCYISFFIEGIEKVKTWAIDDINRITVLLKMQSVNIPQETYGYL